jgi:RNA polymerase sigma-70 factor (ECF subfamily)
MSENALAPAPDVNDLVERARLAHPAFRVPEERLRERLLALGADAGKALRADDVYLTLACLEGERPALDALERRLVAVGEPALSRLGFSRDERADLLQMARHRLLVPEPGQPPRLASYAGRGPLDAWLQALITRLALTAKRARAAAHLDEGNDAWLAWPSPDDDAELALLKRSSNEAFRRAAHEAFHALDPKVRLLLRQHLLDGLNPEQLAALHHVHLVTVYRWLREGRARYLAETRRRLAASLKLEGRDLDSLLRLLESQLDLSLRQLFTHSRGPLYKRPVSLPGQRTSAPLSEPKASSGCSQGGRGHRSLVVKCRADAPRRAERQGEGAQKPAAFRTDDPDNFGPPGGVCSPLLRGRRVRPAHSAERAPRGPSPPRPLRVPPPYERRRRLPQAPSRQRTPGGRNEGTRSPRPSYGGAVRTRYARGRRPPPPRL